MFSDLSLSDWLGIADGEPVAIIGKGPSIARVDWATVPRWRICLNHAANVVPDPSACVVRGDKRGNINPPRWCLIVTQHPCEWSDYPRLTYRPIAYDAVLQWPPVGLWHGKNCIHPAIHLAWCMRAREVYFYGCDAMRGAGEFYAPDMAAVSPELSPGMAEAVAAIHREMTLPALEMFSLKYEIM